MNRYSIIDLDERAMFLTKINRTMGKVLVNVRVNNIGNYGHSQKLTIIAAIDANGFRDMYITEQPGTTYELFTAYIRR